jgi:hypothetical protein
MVIYDRMFLIKKISQRENGTPVGGFIIIRIPIRIALFVRPCIS